MKYLFLILFIPTVLFAEELVGPSFMPQSIYQIKCTGYEGKKCRVYDLPGYRQLLTIDQELVKYRNISFQLESKLVLQEKNIEYLNSMIETLKALNMKSIDAIELCKEDLKTSYEYTVAEKESTRFWTYFPWILASFFVGGATGAIIVYSL